MAKRSTAWIDPATGLAYDARTMTPLPVAGEDLGELPGRSTELGEIADDAAEGFAALLGIDPEGQDRP